jgi:hypothetical protein
MTMPWLYRLFLLLYPREHRDQFGAEMLWVFTESAAERRGLDRIRFTAAECAGLALGAWEVSAMRERLFPDLLAITLAALLYDALLTGSSWMIASVHAYTEGRDGPPVLMLAIYGAVVVLCLIPVIMLVSLRVARARRPC